MATLLSVSLCLNRCVCLGVNALQCEYHQILKGKARDLANYYCSSATCPFKFFVAPSVKSGATYLLIKVYFRLCVYVHVHSEKL